MRTTLQASEIERLRALEKLLGFLPAALPIPREPSIISSPSITNPSPPSSISQSPIPNSQISRDCDANQLVRHYESAIMQYPQDHPLIPSSEDYSMSTSSIGSGRESSSSAPFFYSDRCSNPLSGENSPCNMSPWHHSIPAALIAGDPSGWSMTSINGSSAPREEIGSGTYLIGSLIREEGHIYSLAAAGSLLYTGSDSKNIRVWKNQKEYAAFKSSSGLVKAIVIVNGERIMTGHQDGKIRVWRVSHKDPSSYKRTGTLPRLKDLFKYSLKPSSYVEVRRHRTALWIRHSDAVSCLSIDAEHGLLYSGSWDRTFKIWRLGDSKCLESVVAHEDAVNAVVAAGFAGVVLTGSADGTVKVWRREVSGKGMKHRAVQTLLKQESAVTALAIGGRGAVAYSASSDGVVNFWEWEGDRKGLVHGGALRGHKLAVLCLAAAGGLVLSGSADKTICVWRREAGGAHACLSVLTGHSGPVKCLTIEEEGDGRREEGDGRREEEGDGRREEDSGAGAGGGGGGRFILYSGSLDKSVKVWRVSEQPPEELLRGPHHVRQFNYDG